MCVVVVCEVSVTSVVFPKKKRKGKLILLSVSVFVHENNFAFRRTIFIITHIFSNSEEERIVPSLSRECDERKSREREKMRIMLISTVS